MNTIDFHYAESEKGQTQTPTKLLNRVPLLDRSGPKRLIQLQCVALHIVDKAIDPHMQNRPSLWVMRNDDHLRYCRFDSVLDCAGF